eukprot:scaffold6955_cov63-Phaeocystis_antarctica.AAC.5
MRGQVSCVRAKRQSGSTPCNWLSTRACVPCSPPPSLYAKQSIMARIGSARPPAAPFRACKPPRATTVEAQRAKHKLTQPDFRLCWRSSHEELRYRGRSRPADREEPREAVVRRGHQHHTVEAVSASAGFVFSAAPVKVV